MNLPIQRWITKKNYYLKHARRSAEEVPVQKRVRITLWQCDFGRNEGDINDVVWTSTFSLLVNTVTITDWKTAMSSGVNE